MDIINLPPRDGAFYRLIVGYDYNADPLYEMWIIDEYRSFLRSAIRGVY